MYEQILEEIGLTKSEIKVYEALLELGSSSTGKIIEQANVASSKIYEILEKLIQKGLTSYVITSGVKHFEAAHPRRILDYLKEKKEHLAKQTLAIKAILPELELKKQMNANISETQVFKGLKGAQTAFDDILYTLNTREELLVLGFSNVGRTFQQFLSRFHRKRAEQKILCRMLLGKGVEELSKTLQKLPFTELKFTPEEEERPVAMLIYKDTSLFSLAQDNIWIQVKNKRLADSFRTNFEQLWNKDTKLVQGIQAIKDIFNEMLEIGHADFIGGRGYFVEKEKEFIEDWKQRAIKKGFHMRNIVDKESQEHAITKFPFAKTKYHLPKEMNKLSVYWIFGNKVVIANWIENEPTIIVIENKKFQQLYKQQFEEIWNMK